jgi:hypothetical protein
MENDIKIHGYDAEAKGPATLPEARCYALHDTTIEKGGVIRCCLGTVAAEYEGKQVRLGDKSKCPHCGTTFTLIMVPPGMTTCYTKEVTKTTPVWKPDWQLKEHNDGAMPRRQTE